MVGVNRGVSAIINNGAIPTNDGWYFGPGAWMELPTDLNISNEYTMGGWYKYNNHPPFSNHQIMFGDSFFEISVSIYGETSVMRSGVVVDNVRHVISGETFVPKSGWVHLMSTCKLGGELSLYVNGVLDATLSVPTGTITPLPGKVRAASRWGNIGEYTSDAFYKDLVVYNRELSPSEVFRIYSK